MKRTFALLALGLLAAPAWGQSTGSTEGSLAAQAEKVKKERAARRAAGVRAKSFTNDDLKGAGAGTPAQATPEASSPNAKETSPGQAGAKPEKTADELRAEQRAAIQKKIDEQKKRIEIIQRVLGDAQRELGDLSNYTYGSRRQALQKAVDDSNAEMAKSLQAIADLEEEARRLGVPASR